MKLSYINRSSYKSLNTKNPLLDINQLKTERNQVFEKHKSNLKQTSISGFDYNFDSLYFKKSKQSHFLRSKKDSLITHSGIRLNISAHSNIFSLENIKSPNNHAAWSQEGFNSTQNTANHVLSSKEKIKKGSQFDKFQQRFK